VGGGAGGGGGGGGGGRKGESPHPTFRLPKNSFFF